MAEAIVLGSLLSSGAAAASGAGLIATTGIAGISFGTIASGLGLLGSAVSMFSSADQGAAAYDAQIAASRAELEAGKTRFAESQLSEQREATQAAIEESERQRRLRRTLAAQRASFAGGGAAIDSGSLQRIQEGTIGEINRESNLAALASGDRISSIQRQGLGNLAGSKARASSLIGQAETGLAQSRANTLSQAGSFATGAIDFSKTLKRKNTTPFPQRKPI